MSSETSGKLATKALLETNLPETSTLKLVSRGKVRDLYEIKEKEGEEGEGGEGGDVYLLFVATDRISAFDVVLKNVRAWMLARFVVLLEKSMLIVCRLGFVLSESDFYVL